MRMRKRKKKRKKKRMRMRKRKKKNDVLFARKKAEVIRKLRNERDE